MTLTFLFDRISTQLADAACMMSTRGFGPETTEYLREWYEGTLGKKLFVVGPTFPTTSKPGEDPSKDTETAEFKPIYDFLDAHPAKSVVLVSFGSLFYPGELWQVEALYKVLLETETPFIASRASDKYTALSGEIEAVIEKSGLGLIVDYVPQREVLNHSSLAAFLTHGGVNSLFESVVAGVINIFWPLGADQPVHSVYMSQSVRSSFPDHVEGFY